MSAPSAPDLKSSFDQRRARIFRPVVIVSVVTLVLLAIIAMRLVASNDREAREHEQAMVERGLACACRAGAGGHPAGRMG
jgi:hypothetical protein